MLKLAPNPTFKAKVGIPVPGQKSDVQVEFEFRYMTREEWEQLIHSRESMTDDQAAAEVVVGWSGVDEPFGPDAMAKLLKFYPTAGTAIADCSPHAWG